MPHPSPQQPDSGDLAGGLGTVQPPKEECCVSVPLHAPTPLSSPLHSVVTSSMMAAFSEPTPEGSSSSLMSFNDPNAMHWGNSHGEYSTSTMGSDGTGYHYPLQFPAQSQAVYDYSQNIVPYNENYNLTYSAPLTSSCPRSYTNDIDLTGLPMSNIPQFYPPDAYQIEPQASHHDAMDLSDQNITGQLMQLRHDEYDSFGPMIKHEEHTAYSSPYDSDVTRSSTPCGDQLISSIHDYKIECEDGAIDKEQPYAQLIHRALMEAPGHTMILRDIYEWFKTNTDKAADKETKGWQNSIRHNLSMNGAFEKVDQPCEESKRGFMWRLTGEAIREGVKSTTRYRSKAPNKRVHRSSNPLPQRQASGAKGGQAARRAARMRRSTRMNDNYRGEPYRSVPTGPAGIAPIFDPESSMAYPPTPYYGSPVMSEAEFNYSKDDFGSSMDGSNIELFHHQPRAYDVSPFTQEMPMCSDTAYIQEPMNPTDPIIFTNSPSPTADEPRTPDSHVGAGWGDDMMMGVGGPTMVFDAPYNEYTA